MKIRPRNIPKFQNGNNLWYLNLIGKDYDVNKYQYNYDTSKLVDGDMGDDKFNPWVSNIAGYDKGRYVPTTGYGNFGVGKEHYNYTKGVEGQKYYQKFGLDLLDENGNFTEMGKLWAKAVDALIPQSNHLARFYDNNGNLRTSWSTGHNDAHSRAPLTYNNLKDYVQAIRNDLILGARHNVFLNKGKRYFYKDNDGIKHWVDPNEVGNYTVSKDPIESNWNDDHTIYWEDYELTGPTGSPTSNPSIGSSIPGRYTNKYHFDWKKLGEGLQKYAPNLLAAGRLAYSLNANKRMLNELLAAIKPLLQGSYHTYHQVTGDEGTKLGYYKRAALGQTQAARPITSDSDRQMAYQMEAKRVGDELRAQGDLIDNLEIRRTSEISKQHSDANIARDNQVANHNYLAMLQANAQKHLAKNNYIAANHSSWNNFLLGKETRLNQRIAERQALEDLIFALDTQNRLANDSKYLELYNEMSNAYDEAIKANTDSNGNADYIAARNDPKFKKAQLEFKNMLYRLQRQQYTDMLNRRSNDGLFFAKDGLKIQFKKKDDLLYKTARDAVDHYRKMVKMSDDSMLKSFKKPLKLILPPKFATKKMQTGGVAPFTVYTPAPLGGETTTSTQASALAGLANKKVASEKKEDSTLDIIKDLFKNLEGLPSDVNGVYKTMSAFLARAKAFGTEINSDDLASIYLLLMQQINNIKFSKANYDAAVKNATDNEALDEFAVTDDGKFVSQNVETGEIRAKSWKEIKDSNEWNPLTNNNLLNIRAYSPEYILGKGDISLLTIVNKGIGISKIAEFIKAQLPQLGSNELTIEGYTKKQSLQILEGFKQLLEQAPNGDYHWSKKTEDLKQQITMALGYISSILPKNMKAVLQAHADILGISTTNMLQTLLGAESSETNDLKLTAVTGKAAKDANGNSKSGADTNDMIPAVAFFLGLGDQSTFIIQDKTLDGLKINTVSAPITSKGSNTGPITFDKLSSSDFGGQLLMNLATMGDALIALNGTLNIIIGDRIYQTELPIDKTAKAKGIIKPNLSFLKKIELADTKLKQMGINKSDPKNIPTINKVYQDLGLPILYIISGNKPILTSDYARFAMVNASATQDAFSEEPEFNDGVREATDKERELFETTMLSFEGKSKYKLDNGWIFGIGETKLYNGTIYIPMVNSTISALGGTGYKAKGSEYNEIESLQLQANSARQKGFKAGGNASNL